MKHSLWITTFTLLVCLCVQATAAEHVVYRDPTAPVEQRIDSLLAAMTLEEKIDALGTNPSVPRLGLRLSGHIEGLHGVALGGPGNWATRKSIVLLKNTDDALPLDRHKLESVAVIGPYADRVLLDWYSGTPPYT